MTWLDNLNVYTQAIVVASIIVAFISIINIVIYGLKVNVKERTVRYIYSFSSGFLLITAIVGQFVSAQTSLSVHWRTVNISNGIDSSNPTILQIFISVFIVLAGFVAGIGLSFIIKKIFNKVHHNESSSQHKLHDAHSHVIENRYEHNVSKHDSHSKLKSVMMIATHRIPAGIAMGALVYTSSILSAEGVRTYGLAMSSLIAFAIHLIPESLLIYFTRIHSGESKAKAMLITAASVLVFLPLMIVGVLLGKLASAHDSLFWIQPFMFVIISSILVWEVITELIPEFIHVRKNSKEVWGMLIVFMIGLATSGIIQMIHFH